MPLFDEVSVKKYWPEIIKNNKYSKYFPNMAANEVPEFEYFWNVLIFNFINSFLKFLY